MSSETSASANSGDAAERPGRAERFVVRGRVQGVGFRWWTQRTACAFGVAGRVWNRQDGTVEIEAVGHPGVLDRFAEALGDGPPAARVEVVERSSLDEDRAGRLSRTTDFRIDRSP